MKTLIAFAMITLAGPVQALSCMPLTPQNLFIWADTAEESYVPVYGSFNVPKIKRPKPSKTLMPKGYEVQGSFDGKFVTKTGLTKPVQFPVTVNVTCVASWCGRPPTSDLSVAVLEKTEEGYVYHAHACPSSSLVDPDRAHLRTFRKCLRGADCGGATR